MMRSIVLHIACVFGIGAFAQDSTTTLSTVDVLQKNYEENQVLLNDELIRINASISFADLIQKQSGVFVRRQGFNTLSTLSYRGLGSMHTGIVLAGMNIQSAMNGVMDLSLIPAYHFNSISFGEQGSLWSRNLGSNLNIGYASKIEGFDWMFARNQWGKNSLGTRFDHHSEKLSYSISGFAYKDPNDPNQFYDQAKFTLGGNAQSVSLYQDLKYRFKNEMVFSNQVFLISAHRNLPSLGLSPADARQFDHHMIVTNRLAKTGENIYWAAQHSIWRELISYHSEQSGIQADHEAINNNLNFLLGYQVREGTHMEYLLGVSQCNYTSTQLEDPTGFVRPYLSIRLEQELKHMDLHMNNNIQLTEFGTAYSGNIELAGTIKKTLLKLKVSNTYRLPVLNELYWYEPGRAFGNPDLLPETGYSMELKTMLAPWKGFQVRFTPFYGIYNNLIVWKQGNTLEPENVNQTKNVGVEANIQYQLKRKQLAYTIQSNVQYVSARYAVGTVGNAAGKQVIFTPPFTANITASVKHEFLGAYINMQSVGRNYYTSDNSEYLEPYLILDAGIHAEYENFSTAIGLQNALNTDYGTVPNYPMPKRTLSVQINYTLTKSKNE